MLKLIAASFDLVLGAVLGAVGVPLALWVMVALYQAEVARGGALWALELSPLSHGTAVQLASDLTQRNSLIALGVAAAVLCVMALAALRSARQELKLKSAPTTTHGGKVRVELTTEPLRVGRAVAGSIRLSRKMEPDEAIRVGLACKRSHGSGADVTIEVAFNEVREVPPVRTSRGWSAPFWFDVPAVAPPSRDGYRWILAYSLSRHELPTLLPLDLGPAPEEEFRAIETREALRAMPEATETAVTQEQPSAVSRQPPVVTQQPPVTRHPSLVTQERPPATSRQPPAVTDEQGGSRKDPPAGRENSSPITHHPSPASRHFVTDTASVRKEPTFRTEPTLRVGPALGGDPPLHAPADPYAVSRQSSAVTESREASGIPAFLKWLLIFVLGVPIGIATVAFATVAVLSIVR